MPVIDTTRLERPSLCLPRQPPRSTTRTHCCPCGGRVARQRARLQPSTAYAPLWARPDAIACPAEGDAGIRQSPHTLPVAHCSIGRSGQGGSMPRRKSLVTVIRDMVRERAREAIQGLLASASPKKNPRTGADGGAGVEGQDGRPGRRRGYAEARGVHRARRRASGADRAGPCDTQTWPPSRRRRSLLGVDDVERVGDIMPRRLLSDPLRDRAHVGTERRIGA